MVPEVEFSQGYALHLGSIKSVSALPYTCYPFFKYCNLTENTKTNMTVELPNYIFLAANKVSIVGVPFNGGQPREGVEEGPLRLVEFGLAEQLKEMGWQVEHEANKNITQLRPESDPDVLNLKQPKYVSAVTQHVSKQIYERAKAGNFVLTLGGDHSVALATVSGVFGAHPDACLVWVDAHAVSVSIYN